jgi:hypothetical protein
LDAKEQEFLNSLMELSNSGIGDIGVLGFSVIMAASLLSSWLISLLYLKFYGSRSTGSQIHRAFPLLGLSVTAIFICIQFSLPLSLGLLGALSIVRFRTPIKEPEEIGFIMLIIGASIAVATFSMYFLVILLISAIIALVGQNTVFGFVSRKTEDGMIILTINNDNYQENASELKALLENQLEQPKIESISRSGDSSVISYSFQRIKTSDPMTIQADIADLMNPKDVNIYLNKQATL